METTTKTCSKCKINRNFNFFVQRNTSHDGLNSQCKICTKKYDDENKEKIKLRKKQYYIDNKDRIKKVTKMYTQNNADKIRTKRRVYNKCNKERIRAVAEKYLLLNREDINRKKKKYEKDNSEKILLRKRKFRLKYPVHIREQRRRYRNTELSKISRANLDNKRRKAKRTTSDGTIPQSVNFPLTKELQELLVNQNYKCIYCKCNISHTLHNIHLDHIIPLSKNGTHSINNVQWLCATCNLSKGNKIL